MTDPQSAPAPIASAAEAEAAVRRLDGVIDALVDTLNEETRLVRAGRLSEAVGLRDKKNELTRCYLVDAHRLGDCLKKFAPAMPQAVAALRNRHEAFRSLLQTNLTVLATAHAVSEGVMRGVADEIAKKSAPQTYGASGRQGTPDPRHARPLALSRTL
jgi:hypothetical protein